MAGTRGRDTVPERALRSAVHRLGLRFRVGIRPVPSVRRTADLVFTRQRLAVFVDGCFWHGCPDHATRPLANRAFWSAKLEQNRKRDHETEELLRDAGWTVLRVWEHEPADSAALRIRDALASRAGGCAADELHPTA